MSRARPESLLMGTTLILAALGSIVLAQDAPQHLSSAAVDGSSAVDTSSSPESDYAPGGSARHLPTVVVTGRAFAQGSNNATSPEIQRFQPPLTVESINQQQIQETTNTIDTEDAIKYLPSLLVRKRNFGDTQPTLATRTWGINSSARSLVYVDDVPINALISNNNTSGSPRWGMVSPGTIAGVDMLYGPFAAEYPGNAMGGVLLITTQMPNQLEASLDQAEALQTFDLYRTHHTYQTSNTTVTVGDKNGPFSWFLSANREDTFDQPLFTVTSATIPAGTEGTIPALNKTGASANVVGAGGIQHAILQNFTGKFAFDLTSWLRATYSLGFFENHTVAVDQSYLTTTAGSPTYGGVSGFASQNYTFEEQHLMNALSFKTHTNGHWDWEAIATRYDYLEDIQRSPTGVASGDA
ncbi:MAG TPA: TonB-dependent receptor, partial [Steroidobacteraceae bacterium]|nr:TonB-dependent receptor [Steroidobacteraceae bacterium]